MQAMTGNGILLYKMKFQEIELSEGTMNLGAMTQEERKMKNSDAKYTKEKFDDIKGTHF